MAALGLRNGTTINGKWQVGQLLGRGGMAEVYAATHRNGKRAALKILHPELVNTEPTLRRFAREGYAANRVGHPAVVTVDDDDVCEDGSPYLVMELLQGQTLEGLREARGGRLAVPEVLDLGEALMEVIAMAHRRGVVHRDIKPSNLFLTDAGILKVLDFGIARVNDQRDRGETTLESFLGTPAYMSPEQARGRWELVDARSDIYSIGATLFTLLTGSHVHSAATRNEQLGLAMAVQAPSLASVLPRVHASLAAVVDRALRYDRRERWADVESMRRAWQRSACSLAAAASDDGLTMPRTEAVLPARPQAAVTLVGSPASQLERNAACDPEPSLSPTVVGSLLRARGRRWSAVGAVAALALAAVIYVEGTVSAAFGLTARAEALKTGFKQARLPGPWSRATPARGSSVEQPLIGAAIQTVSAAPATASAPRPRTFQRRSTAATQGAAHAKRDADQRAAELDRRR